VLGRGYAHADVEWISSAPILGSVYADSAWRHGAGALWDVLPHVLAQVVPVLGDVVDASVTTWPEFVVIASSWLILAAPPRTCA